MLKFLESDLETLMKRIILFLYMIAFYFQNSEYLVLSKIFWGVGETNLLLPSL